MRVIHKRQDIIYQNSPTYLNSPHEKPKDSCDIDYPRNEERLANRFFHDQRSLEVSLGPYRETSVSKINWKNRFLLGLGSPIRDILLIFWDDRFTTLSSRMGLFQSCVAFKKDMPSLNQQKIYISSKNRYFLGVRKTSLDKTLPCQNIYRTFFNKKSICPESSLNNIKAS